MDLSISDSPTEKLLTSLRMRKIYSTDGKPLVDSHFFRESIPAVTLSLRTIGITTTEGIVEFLTDNNRADISSSVIRTTVTQLHTGLMRRDPVHPLMNRRVTGMLVLNLGMEPLSAYEAVLGNLATATTARWQESFLEIQSHYEKNFSEPPSNGGSNIQSEINGSSSSLIAATEITAHFPMPTGQDITPPVVAPPTGTAEVKVTGLGDVIGASAFDAGTDKSADHELGDTKNRVITSSISAVKDTAFPRHNGVGNEERLKAVPSITFPREVASGFRIGSQPAQTGESERKIIPQTRSVAAIKDAGGNILGSTKRATNGNGQTIEDTAAAEGFGALIRRYSSRLLNPETGLSPNSSDSFRYALMSYKSLADLDYGHRWQFVDELVSLYDGQKNPITATGNIDTKAIAIMVMLGIPSEQVEEHIDELKGQIIYTDTARRAPIGKKIRNGKIFTLAALNDRLAKPLSTKRGAELVHILKSHNPAILEANKWVEQTLDEAINCAQPAAAPGRPVQDGAHHDTSEQIAAG